MLELKSFQIMELQDYLNEVRPTIITEASNQLFVSMKGNKNLHFAKIYHKQGNCSKAIQHYNNVTKLRPRFTKEVLPLIADCQKKPTPEQ